MCLCVWRVGWDVSLLGVLMVGMQDGPWMIVGSSVDVAVEARC